MSVSPTSGQAASLPPDRFPSPTTLNLEMTNSCESLLHIVIFDYVNYSSGVEEENEGVLFSLDSSMDRMDSATQIIQRSCNRHYVIRAYFTDGYEVEKTVYVPSGTLEITIQMTHSGLPDIFFPKPLITILQENKKKPDLPR